MHPMLNIAVRAARQAGNIIARSADHVDALAVTSKARNDFVTDVDRLAEEEIIRVIRKAYPDHGFLAEESGVSEGNVFQWIIDPLDGTTNYLHGFPQYAVSIALRYKNRLEVGVVYNPVSQELFTASKGDGAQLNGRRIRVSNHKTLEGALIGTGFPFKNPELLDTYLETFKAIHPHAAGIRRPGSAALDLAYLAAGRIDGFWEFALNPWDMAAGVLLIQEAGGLVSDLGGGHDFLDSGNVVAGNPKMLKALLQAIRPHLPADMRK